MRILKTFLVIFITIGAITGSLGQIIYAISALFTLFEINSAWLIIPTLTLASSSTLLVRAQTRLPALHKMLKNKKEEKRSNSDKFSRKAKTIIAIATVITISSGLTATLSAFVGGTTLAQLGQFTNPIVINSVGLYAAGTSFLATFSFIGSNAISNTKELIRSYNANSFGTQNTKHIVLTSLKTMSITGLGALAFGFFSFFTVASLTEKLTQEAWIILSSGLLACCSTLGATALSRVLETYHYLDKSEDKLKRMYSKCGLLLISFPLAAAYTDLLSFFLAIYSSCLNNATYLGLEPLSWPMLTLSCLPALSASAMHYIFSVRSVNQTYFDLAQIKTPRPKEVSLINIDKIAINYDSLPKPSISSASREQIAYSPGFFKTAKQENIQLEIIETKPCDFRA